MCICFLAIIPPFCGNLGNYYDLSIAGEKSMLCCSVSDFDFLRLDGRKKGVVTMPVPKDLVPQPPTKKLAHLWVLFGHPLSQNRVSKVSDLGTLLIK